MRSAGADEDKKKVKEDMIISQRGPPSSLDLAVRSIRLQINRNTVCDSSDPDELERNLKSCLEDVQRHRRAIEQQISNDNDARETVDAQQYEELTPTRRNVGKRRCQASSHDLVSPSFNKDTAASFLKEYVAVAATVGGGSWTDTKLKEVFTRYSKTVFANDEKIEKEDNDELRRKLPKLYSIDIGSAMSYAKTLQKQPLEVVMNYMLDEKTDTLLRDMYNGMNPKELPTGIDSSSVRKKQKKQKTTVALAPLNGERPFINNYEDGYLGGVQHRIELAKAKRAELIRLLASGAKIPDYMSPTVRLVADGTARWVCGICGDNVQRPTSNKAHTYRKAHEGHIMYKKGSKVLYCCYSDAEETAANFEEDARRYNRESTAKNDAKKPKHPALALLSVTPKPDVENATASLSTTSSWER